LKKKPVKIEQSVVSEAWQNMSADMEKFLPQKLRGGKGRWKFALALALFELVLLGVVGKYLYERLTG
jgi:hypothetical protein